MNAPDWLIARPIAHRGLHARARGVIENSPSAASAAVAGGFAIECDVQISRDGEAMVFHDFELERLTGETGALRDRTASDLARIQLSGSEDSVPTLEGWLALVGGRTPVICEIKSSFDGDMGLAARTARIAKTYAGPIALKSFDPDIVAWLRREASALGVNHIPVGLVAQAAYTHADWRKLDARQLGEMTALTHWARTRPDFLSWSVNDLPHPAPSICKALGIPVMAWTVRRPDQVKLAHAFTDQMIFEGFTP
ncbi:MAG: glycerophosphodiester phosphodiesterase family protein [Beijerinckiaceae bacterium]|nr:glycerophosphodiester phosphodiesterase family protein [Beijerinckiaceae bacterium]